MGRTLSGRGKGQGPASSSVGSPDPKEGVPQLLPSPALLTVLPTLSTDTWGGAAPQCSLLAIPTPNRVAYFWVHKQMKAVLLLSSLSRAPLLSHSELSSLGPPASVIA